MNLKFYFNLYEVLQHDSSSKEERRAFGLKHILLKDKPYAQLGAWVKSQLHTVKKPPLYEKYAGYLYGVTLILSLLGFVFGLLSGVALLHYNGHAPVNVVYFMAMVIALPLLTMTLTLFSMLKATQSKSVLVHLTPSFWMEKIIMLLPKKWDINFNELHINPLLANWIVIKRSQLIALFFSLGLLIALLMVVATQDIAFAWSTTLDIQPERFHDLLQFLSTPWQTWVPSAVPSLELVEKSQYFRLGEKLSSEMIDHASILGEWWKFLVMATFFYAIFLRFLFFLVASAGLKFAVKKSLMRLDEVEKLLHDMNTPIITTHALDEKEEVQNFKIQSPQTLQRLDASYDVVQGWAMSKDKLMLLNDAMGIISPLVFDVGGIQSLDEDKESIAKSHGEVLVYVKAWEPPTMDFIDYLEALSMGVDKVVIFPIGTQENGYHAQKKDVTVWVKKLSEYASAKVWVKV